MCDRLACGIPAPEVLREIGEWLGEVEFGCILLGPDTHAAGSNRAWPGRSSNALPELDMAGH